MRGSLRLCGIPHRASPGLGSRAPNWKHIHEPPVSRATPKCKTSAFVHFCRCAKGGACPIHMEETYKIPNDDVAGTSGRFRELRPAHKMHGGPLTERGDHHLVDPHFLPVHYRTADVSARFRCSLGCFEDVNRDCCFGVETVLYLVSAPGWRSRTIDSLGSPLLFSHTAKMRICAHPVSSSLDHFRPYRHHQI